VLVSPVQQHVPGVTYHASDSRALLRLEKDGLVLAAFLALLLDAR